LRINLTQEELVTFLESTFQFH